MMKTILRLTFLIGLLSGSAGISFGQVTTGTPPFGSFATGPAGTVNMGNLNVHIDIPVLHKAGRGAPFNYDITYDTSFWTRQYGPWSPVAPPYSSFGWFFPVQGSLEATISSQNFCYTFYPGYGYIPSGEVLIDEGYVYYDPLGTPHPLPGVLTYVAGTCGSGASFSGSGPASDGSGYLFGIDPSLGVAALLAKDGQVIRWGQSGGSYVQPVATDNNGNEITVDTSDSIFTDTLGDTALTLGGSGTPTSSRTFTYTAPSGASAQYTLVYSSYTIKTNFGCTGVSEYGPTAQNLPSELDLPDGSKYVFTYESTPGYTGDYTGRLASIKLPTGGTIYYTYSGPNDGIECTDGSTSGLTRQTPDGTWTYSRTLNGGAASTTTITDPSSNQTLIDFVGIYPTESQVYQGAAGGTPLETTYTCYNGAAPNCNSTAITLPITQETVYPQWANGQESETNTYYNSYGLVTEQDDYDYGSGAPGPLLRKTTTSYASLGNGIVDRPSQVSVYNGSSSLVAQTDYSYDQYSLAPSGITTQHVSVSGSRGNLTSVSKWLNTNGSWLTSTSTYFDTGMVDVATDAKGNPTTYAYTSTYAGAYPTTVTNALNQQTNNAYDPNSGQVTSTTDPNGQTTSYTYDSMMRPLTVSYPDGGQTNYSYAAEFTGSYAGIDQKKDTTGDWSQSYAWFDPLGRPARAVTPSGESSPWNEVGDTCYNSVGLVSFKSYPYQDYGWGGPPPCNTAGDSYTYDALGRVKKVTHSDGSAINASYSGPCSTVTDEQGKTREMCTDGLDRLTEVIENPGGLNYTTNYSYDALGNVTGVTQSGSRQRTFVYDSLSRLISSTNPESGTTTYAYDANGNVASRTDARGITATCSYDALNRVTARTYSDGTPGAYYFYDQSSWVGPISNGVGRLTSEGVNNGSAWLASSGFSYDPVGRVINNPQQINYTTYQIPYTYDLLGDVTSYGSGTGAEVFTQSINAASLPTQVTASWSDPYHPATLVSNVHYNAAGELVSATLGNGLTETAAYNGLLQPCRSNVNSSGAVLGTCGDSEPSGNYLDLTAGYNYGSGDNGNVTSWSAVGAQNFNRSYTYDALNRLASMSAPGDQCTGLTWTYDAWGNRTDQTATGGTCNTFHQSADSNNRLMGPTYQYDAAGNLIYDGVHSYYYDAEDRLIQVDGTLGNCPTSTACYVYDAQGRRIQKTTGSNNLQYTYDLSGRVSSEICQPCGTYNGWSGGYVFLAGRMLAQYTDGTVLFTQTDHLGSTRLLTGYPTSSIAACYDYYPFGEIISCGATGDQSQKFTGYLRDSETNLDDANARYFASSLGRFMSPDPSGLYFADPTDPQTLNLYSYVRDNPLSMIDPTGLIGGCPTGEISNGVNCVSAAPPTTVGVIYDEGCDLTCQLYNSIYQGIGLGTTPVFLQPPSVYIDLPQAGGGGGGNGGGGAGSSVPSAPSVSGTQPQAPTPAQAATNYCQQHGQLSFNIPFTHIPVTIGFSATLFGNYGTTNDIALTFPPSAGASLDITVGAPAGPNIPVQAGSGKDLSIGTFLTPSGPSGFSASFGPSVGSPVTFSPQVANACGLKAGGG